METIPDLRLFGYALLAAVVAFASLVWLSPGDAGWALPVAIAVFSVLLFVDGVVAGRQTKH